MTLWLWAHRYEDQCAVPAVVFVAKLLKQLVVDYAMVHKLGKNRTCQCAVCRGGKGEGSCHRVPCPSSQHFFVTALLHVAPCHAVAAEREAVAAVSRAVVDAPKASLSALCRSKAVTIEEQKVLAAVRASRAPPSVF